MYGDEDRRTTAERLADRLGLKKDASPEELVAAALAIIHELDRRPAQPPVIAIQAPPAIVGPFRPPEVFPPSTPDGGWKVYCQHGGG